MGELRKVVTKLATENAELRRYLVPILKMSAVPLASLNDNEVNFIGSLYARQEFRFNGKPSYIISYRGADMGNRFQLLIRRLIEKNLVEYTDKKLTMVRLTEDGIKLGFKLGHDRRAPNQMVLGYPVVFNHRSNHLGNPAVWVDVKVNGDWVSIKKWWYGYEPPRDELEDEVTKVVNSMDVEA